MNPIFRSASLCDHPPPAPDVIESTIRPQPKTASSQASVRTEQKQPALDTLEKCLKIHRRLKIETQGGHWNQAFRLRKWLLFQKRRLLDPAPLKTLGLRPEMPSSNIELAWTRMYYTT